MRRHLAVSVVSCNKLVNTRDDNPLFAHELGDTSLVAAGPTLQPDVEMTLRPIVPPAAGAWCSWRLSSYCTGREGSGTE